MEANTGKTIGEIRSMPPLQRMGSGIKRAVLIPQKTNLRLEFNNNEAVISSNEPVIKSRRPSLGKAPLSARVDNNELAIVNARQPTAGHAGRTTRKSFDSNNNNDPYYQLSQNFNEANIELFANDGPTSPTIGLTREESKIKRTRVIEEMYRIQQRAKITPGERQHLFQLAITMDAPKLARKLVSDTRELDSENSNGSFLTGELKQQRRLSKERSTIVEGINGMSEDDLFCKAFDEVERIRQRILLRANTSHSSCSNNYTSNNNCNLSPKRNSDRPQSTSPRARVAVSPRLSSPRAAAVAAVPKHQQHTNHVLPPLLEPVSAAASIVTTTTTASNNVRAQAAWSKIYPEGGPPSSSSGVSKQQSANSPKRPILSKHDSNNSLLDHDLQVTEALDSLIGSTPSSHHTSRVGSKRAPGSSKSFLHLVESDHDHSQYSFPDSFLQSSLNTERSSFDLLSAPNSRPLTARSLPPINQQSLAHPDQSSTQKVEVEADADREEDEEESTDEEHAAAVAPMPYPCEPPLSARTRERADSVDQELPEQQWNNNAAVANRRLLVPLGDTLSRKNAGLLISTPMSDWMRLGNQLQLSSISSKEETKGLPDLRPSRFSFYPNEIETTKNSQEGGNVSMDHLKRSLDILSEHMQFQRMSLDSSMQVMDGLLTPSGIALDLADSLAASGRAHIRGKAVVSQSMVALPPVLHVNSNGTISGSRPSAVVSRSLAIEQPLVSLQSSKKSPRPLNKGQVVQRQSSFRSVGDLVLAKNVVENYLPQQQQTAQAPPPQNSRLFALAAALDAGDAMGKLMAEMMATPSVSTSSSSARITAAASHH